MDERLTNSRLERAIELMPKVELHVHFEGSIPGDVIEQLAQKNGVALEGRNRANPALKYGHLINFLEAYRLRCRCLSTRADFERAAAAVLHNLREQSVRYAEITIAPTMHRLNNVPMKEVMTGLDAAARRARVHGEFDVRFIFDIGRQFGVEHAWQTLREAVLYMDLGVVAIGLGGDELHYSPEIYAEHFATAKRQGLHVVAHAGEVGGPASIWGAVKSLGAERIGHGIGARGDERLLEHLKVENVAVEMCPTSNVETGAVRSYEEHPLPEFLHRGLTVSLNSDDPAMFGVSLTEEYKLSSRLLGLSWDDIKTLSFNSVRGSFLPDVFKQDLLEEIQGAISKIESRENLT
ncbi:MAG: adenosine deaminase [Candidatus Abyssobacteria bacterium SURF_5]|uniref:Adenosine deaminase n=1 Tax=Abyssobacteria bacterium (strain SURF_5) TaxID=2093360 RepID=A0A3A4NZC1_ABYX5|nr:MAG: adenosine deaminase [Candidatus Abyssubacteria bacterium SURF_5]